MLLNLITALYNSHNLRKNHLRGYAALEELQEKKLKTLIEYSYCKVGYYKRLFDKVGIKPEDIKSVRDITKIPITIRKDLWALPKKDITAKEVDLSRCANLRTSGSTGMPLDIFVSAREIQSRGLFYRIMFSENGSKFREKLAVITSPQNFVIKTQLHRLGILTGILQEKYISLFDSIESQLKIISEFKPEIIVGYASSLNNLAIEIKKRKIKGINPRIVFSSAELLSTRDRELIASVFESEIIDYYSCNECGIIAWECKEHNGYHINSDNAIVEFIKEDGTQAKPGEEGEIAITSLNSYTMPFIRYKLGDIGILSDRQCPCGRTLPLMKVVAGRINDCIILPDGRRISPYVLMITMDKISELGSYQLIQEERNKLKVNIIQNSRITPETIARIRKNYKELLGTNIEIEPVVVDNISKGEAGKFKVIVSRISANGN